MSRLQGVPRLVANALALALTTTGLFACSSGGSSPAKPSPPAPARSNVVSPTDATTAPPSSAAPTSIAPQGSPALSSCRIGDLTLRDPGTNLIAGEEHFGTILATNTSSGTCTIDGYPGIVPITSNGGVLAANLQRSTYAATPQQVVLRPGAIASFGFGRFSQGQPPCVTVTGLRVFDPDGSGYKTTNSSFPNCSGGSPVVLEVGPFVAGGNGSVFHRHA